MNNLDESEVYFTKNKKQNKIGRKMCSNSSNKFENYRITSKRKQREKNHAILVVVCAIFIVYSSLLHTYRSSHYKHTTIEHNQCIHGANARQFT